MLALSTSFISTLAAPRKGLLGALAQYGVSHIELDCRITRRQFEQIKARLNATALQVSSLHNYCPFPDLKPNAPPGGDYFLLSCPDKEERHLAVTWTIKTIEHANDVGAGAVVLHCGAVPMTPGHESIYALYGADEGASETLQAMLAAEMARRKQFSTPCVDALLFSLDRLLPVAQKYGVVLGLETRYHYFELPDFDELGSVLDEFDGAPIGYWHDTGHAHVLEQMGITDHGRWLETHGHRLVGMHLHDAKGLEDHLAPGLGDIDFQRLGSVIRPETPLVVELSPGTAPDAVAHAVAFARDLAALI